MPTRTDTLPDQWRAHLLTDSALGIPLMNTIVSQDHKLRPRPLRAPLAGSIITTLTRRLSHRLLSRYAPSTIQRHNYLNASLTHFERALSMPHEQETLLLFLEWIAPTVLPSTLLTYGRTLRSMYPLLATKEFDVYLESVAKNGGLKPTKQAPSLTQEDLAFLLSRFPPSVKWALWVAWKTASRWDEILRLSRNDLTVVSATEVVIDFAEKTKASAMAPFRPDMLVVLRDETPAMQTFLNFVLSLRPTQKLTTVTTPQFTAMIRRYLPLSHYSGQSVKRGAANKIVSLAAQGLINPNMISHMLKHKGGPPKISETSVRYVTDKVSLAQVLGSGDVTVLM